MNDVMEIARKRRGYLESAITKREIEIARLREKIEELNMFLDYAEELIEADLPDEQPAPQAAMPAAPQMDDEASDTEEEPADVPVHVLHNPEPRPEPQHA